MDGHAAHVQGKRTTFEALEAELLLGQKLQGVLTSDEVQAVLRRRGWQQDYPLFTTVNLIIHETVKVQRLFEYREVALMEDVLEPLSDDAGLPG
jgi:glycerol-3-phosphate dehydrogenase (NAD+)